MNIFTIILLFTIASGVVGKVDANPEATREARVALERLAATKEAAVIKLGVKAGPDLVAPFLGVFISADGLALIDLRSIGREEKPEVLAAGGIPLELGPIRGILPHPGFALMKFEHQPLVWLPLAPAEPQRGELMAIIPFSMKDSWTGAIPPVIGPVMAERSALITEDRVARFSRILSLGAGLSIEQRSELGRGAVAIDQRGNLVGFFYGLQVSPSQTVITLAPVAGLGDKIGVLEKEGKTVPRAEARQRIDLDALDRDFLRMNLARQRRDRAGAQRHMKKLLKRYPNNLRFKILAATDDLLVNPESPLIELAGLRPDPNTPKAEQVALLNARAQTLNMRNDLEGAIRELKAAIDLSPQNLPESRVMLGQMYQKSGRLDEAELLFEETCLLLPESIDLNSKYQVLLYKRRKFDQGDKLGERLEELDEIYARR